MDQTLGMLGVEAAALFLGVPVSFIRRLVAERRVKYFKVGKYVKFNPADLEIFATSRPVEVAPARRR